MNKNSGVKGISISSVSKIASILLVIFSIGIVVIVVEIITSNDKIWESTQEYTRSLDAVADIRESSNYLADECKLFLETENFNYVYNYFYEMNNNRRIEKANKILENNKENSDYSEAMISRNHMKDKELFAMKLMIAAAGYDEKNSWIPQEIKDVKLTVYELSLDKEKQKKIARSVLNSSIYINEQNNFSTKLSAFKIKLTDQLYGNMTKASNKHIFMINIMIIIVVGLFAVIVSFLVILGDSVFTPISIFLQCIHDNIRVPLRGSVEMRELALTYNNMFEKRKISMSDKKYDGKRKRITGAVNSYGFNETIFDIGLAKKQTALMYIEIDDFNELKHYKSQSSIDILSIELYNCICSIADYKDDVFEIDEGLFAVFLFGFKPDNQTDIENAFSKLHYKIQTTDLTSEITVSCGVSFTDISGYDTTLINNANVALYQAKDKGGDCIMFYNGSK